MLKLTYKAITYPARQDLHLSEQEKKGRNAIVLSLGFKDRWRGYGEAPEVLEPGGATMEDMIAIIEKQKRFLEDYNLNDPPRFWHFLHHLVKYKPIISAFDMAGWDLWAKISASSTRTILELPKDGGPTQTSFTLETGTEEEITKRIEAMPWPIYKLNVDDDAEKCITALKTIRRLAPEAKIRLDPAESWSRDTAEKLLPVMEEVGIEYLEQPFHRDSNGNQEWLREATKIPIMADESVQEQADAIRMLGKYDGIVIKLAKVEGISIAQRIVKLLKPTKKKIVLDSYGEGAIGTTAIAQFLPVADYADLDGPFRLAHNVGKGLSYENGDINVPYGPGFGLSFN